MQPDNKEQRAVMTICLLAAFSDGSKSESEREQIRKITEGLGAGENLNLPGLYQDVLLKRVTVESAAAVLPAGELRQLAYEMAVCVCDADGARQTARASF